MRLTGIARCLRGTATTSAMIFLILLGAETFNAFLAQTRTPMLLAEAIRNSGLTPMLVLLAMLALLVAMEVLSPEDVADYIVLGELGLDGSLAPVAGVLPAAMGAVAMGRGIVCPAGNGGEGRVRSDPRHEVGLPAGLHLTCRGVGVLPDALVEVLPIPAGTHGLHHQRLGRQAGLAGRVEGARRAERRRGAGVGVVSTSVEPRRGPQHETGGVV